MSDTVYEPRRGITTACTRPTSSILLLNVARAGRVMPGVKPLPAAPDHFENSFSR